jgi:hypothetical protein
MTARLFTHGKLRIGNFRVCRNEKVFMDWQKLPNVIPEDGDNPQILKSDRGVVRSSWQAEE